MRLLSVMRHTRKSPQLLPSRRKDRDGGQATDACARASGLQLWL